MHECDGDQPGISRLCATRMNAVSTSDFLNPTMQQSADNKQFNSTGLKNSMQYRSQDCLPTIVPACNDTISSGSSAPSLLNISP